MQIIVDIDNPELVQAAFAARYGYSSTVRAGVLQPTVPNPESQKPVPNPDFDPEDENSEATIPDPTWEAEINNPDWRDDVPNPETPEQFLHRSFENFVHETVQWYQTQQEQAAAQERVANAPKVGVTASTSTSK